ncbi:MAG TPA: Holliday junction resolvase RuvX [Salinivirga sp.]|uniref:Holliday junction resolvase RuvX n=1 Tax=Salinivirga sp. TaxID=1970192 RepID=UPI002B464B16|nr:Holliday junction resolvase RuvX [Salinivirga sp.]HKK57835.1 Holliday junction resolvase RuvX [Salinivirga sp.]
MGRILAIDYGLKRTGLAVTDPDRIIASGLTTVATHTLLNFISGYLAKEQVDEIVVGLPVQMNNTPSETEPHIRGFLKKLGKKYPQIPVRRVDERFTSKMAQQSMLDGGLKKTQRQNKALVDEISATIILQTYLNKPF